MQIERWNASPRWLALIALAAHFFYASIALSQSSPIKSNQPILTPAANKSSDLQSSAGTPPPTTQVVTIDPNLLVLNAIRQSVWGPPLACKVYQRSLAYDQQVITSGEYKASGLGTGQFRYNARVSSGETTLDRVEVSDGRLMFTQIASTRQSRSSATTDWQRYSPSG
jgi:hypothetical protein